MSQSNKPGEFTRSRHIPLSNYPSSQNYPLELGDPSLPFLLKATGQKDFEGLREFCEKLRERLYEVYPYRCITRFGFLICKAAKEEIYPHVLSLKDDPDALYLDLGCFAGTDVRRLAYDGWPEDRIIGSDLRQDWMELGYELFPDKQVSKIRFLPGDIFSNEFLDLSSTAKGSEKSLTQFKYSFRAISSFAFFHLFSEDDQLNLALRLRALLSPKKGSTIFGSHQGSEVCGLILDDGVSSRSRDMFCHSPESFVDLWEKVVFPASRGLPVGLGKGEPWAEIRVKAKAVIESRAGGDGKTRTLRWSVVVL